MKESLWFLLGVYLSGVCFMYYGAIQAFDLRVPRWRCRIAAAAISVLWPVGVVRHLLRR